MTKTITIFQQNDTHGCIQTHDEFYWDKNQPILQPAGGLSKINAYVKKVKENTENVLFFDGGDLFHGTLPLVESRGEALIPILQQMELDGFVPGNWDFAYGKEQLKKLVEQLPFPTLACNVKNEEDGSPFLTPYIIREMTGIKVGIIGLTYGHEEKTMPASFTEGLSFSLGVDEVRACVNQINDQVDLIVVVSHLGLPLDTKLASMINGIDLILSGHSHDRVMRPIEKNGTIVVQAGSNAAFLGRLDITVHDREIIRYDYELLDVHNEWQEDAIVEELVKSALQPYDGMMNDIVGATDDILHRMTLHQASMDELITKSYLHSYHADIALSHGWRYGPPVGKGPITLYDLHSIIPTNPKLFTVELEGRELLQAMENNLEMVHSKDPFEQKGGYVLRSSGLSLTYKPYSPKGYRIQTFHIGNEELDEHKTYKIVSASAQILKGFEERKMYEDALAIDGIQTFLRDAGTFKIERNDHIITV